MSVLLVDNFDSFTFNLYQYIGTFNQDIQVVRNNNIPFENLRHGTYSHIVISPGPGNPTNSTYFGDANKMIMEYFDKIPILGVCLGHQGIGAAFGAKIINAPTIKHGKTSTLNHSGTGILHNLPTHCSVMRYHSLVIDYKSLPKELSVDAYAEDDETVMAIHHNDYPVFGIQFHPESFCTINGLNIIENFLYGNY